MGELRRDGYPRAWPVGAVPLVWREFGSRRLMCSWCGAQRRKGNRLHRPLRVRCGRCPIEFRRYRRGKRVLED
jgi:hypothetical protein